MTLIQVLLLPSIGLMRKSSKGSITYPETINRMPMHSLFGSLSIWPLIFPLTGLPSSCSPFNRKYDDYGALFLFMKPISAGQDKPTPHRTVEVVIALPSVGPRLLLSLNVCASSQLFHPVPKSRSGDCRTYHHRRRPSVVVWQIGGAFAKDRMRCGLIPTMGACFYEVYRVFHVSSGSDIGQSACGCGSVCVGGRVVVPCGCFKCFRRQVSGFAWGDGYSCALWIDLWWRIWCIFKSVSSQNQLDRNWYSVANCWLIQQFFQRT